MIQWTSYCTIFWRFKWWQWVQLPPAVHYNCQYSQ